MKRLLLLASLTLGAGPVWAEPPAECRVAENLAESSFRLPHVTRALAAKRLTVLVVGAGSSQLPGSSGATNAYPARLLHALTQQLPGVDVKLTTDVKAKRTAAEMVKALPALLSASKPVLLFGRQALSTRCFRLIQINSARHSTVVLTLPIPRALMLF